MRGEVTGLYIGRQDMMFAKSTGPCSPTDDLNISVSNAHSYSLANVWHSVQSATHSTYVFPTDIFRRQLSSVFTLNQCSDFGCYLAAPTTQKDTKELGMMEEQLQNDKLDNYQEEGQFRTKEYRGPQAIRRLERHSSPYSSGSVPNKRLHKRPGHLNDGSRISVVDASLYQVAWFQVCSRSLIPPLSVFHISLIANAALVLPMVYFVHKIQTACHSGFGKWRVGWCTSI